MEDPSPAAPCAHLQALLPGPNAASIIGGWDNWGVVRLLSSEPDSELAAHTPGLRAEITDVRTSGYAYAWHCQEHGQTLGWGKGPTRREEVTQHFLTVA